MNVLFEIIKLKKENYAIYNFFFDIESNDGSYFNTKLQNEFGCT
jgi:hypothetical protein